MRRKMKFEKAAFHLKKKPFIARNPWERQLWDGGHRGSSGSLGAACLVLLPDRRFGRMRKVLHRSFESKSIYFRPPWCCCFARFKREDGGGRENAEQVGAFFGEAI